MRDNLGKVPRGHAVVEREREVDGISPQIEQGTAGALFKDPLATPDLKRRDAASSL